MVVAADAVGQLGADRVVTVRWRILAVFPGAAAAFLALGEALTPKGLDNTTSTLAGALKQLRIAEAHPSRFALASVLIMFGLAALGVTFSTLATLVRHRGATLATVAAVVGWFAAICGVIENAVLNFSLAAAGAARPDATAAKIFLQENTHGLSTVLLVLYFFPLLACVAVMAFALWRARVVPRWLPPIFAATFYLAFFAPPGSFPGPLFWLPFIAVMLYLSTLVWRQAAHRR